MLVILLISCKSDKTNEPQTDQDVEVKEKLPSPIKTIDYLGFQKPKRTILLDDSLSLNGLAVSFNSAFLYCLDQETSSVKSYHYSTGKYAGAFVLENFNGGSHLTTSGRTLIYRTEDSYTILDGEQPKTFKSGLPKGLRFIDFADFDGLHELGLEKNGTHNVLHIVPISSHSNEPLKYDLLLEDCFSETQSGQSFLSKNPNSKNHYLLDETGVMLEMDSTFQKLACYNLPETDGRITGASINSFGEFLVLYRSGNQNVLHIF